MNIFKACVYTLFFVLLTSCKSDDQSEEANDPVSAPPTGSISITSPSANSRFEHEQTITIEVEIKNLINIKAIEIWANQIKLQSNDAAPWSFVLNNLAPGNYELNAKAILTDNSEITSAAIAITVKEKTFIYIASPDTGGDFIFGDIVNVQVDAFDADNIQSVKLFVNNELHDVDLSSPYSFSVENLSEGMHSFKAVLEDSLGNRHDSEETLIEILAPEPPAFVLITTPSEGTELIEGNDLNVEVDAFDSNGIQKVDVFINGQLLQTEISKPYQFTISELPIGGHTLFARSTDNTGVTLDSAPIRISVIANEQPEAFVVITSPETGTTINASDTLIITAEAFDPDGIEALRLRINNSHHSTDKNAPYQFELSDLSEGTYSVTVRSRDLLGNPLDSAPISITVNPEPVEDPFVMITSPENGAKYIEGEAVEVLVDAFDSDGIDAARLWLDGNYYDVDSTEPYSFSLTDLSVGSHTLMVRTRDNLDNPLDSETVTIEIQQAPYLKFDSPTQNSSFVENETIQVIVNAFDPDGLTEVQLWIDGVKFVSTNSTPYNFELTDLEAGSYVLQLQSIDTLNNVLLSSEITITITPEAEEPELILLPIEVFGPSNSEQTIEFNLPDAANASHLYIQCNACGYHELALDKDPTLIKAMVKVNDGDAIPLKKFIESEQTFGNNQISLLDGSIHYGGIGGGFRTVKMMVPTSSFKQGLNTVTFTHRDAIPPSIGYRIVDFNVLADGSIDNKLLSSSQIQLENPSLWLPPFDDEMAIEEGRQLWNAKDILHDPWVDRLDGQMNRNGSMTGDIKASCASCHARDGRDLKYFNFSNHSIVERSKFHGLTEEQGQKIASYIRQLNIPVTERARPWNPTYQPGAGMDSVPIYEWAAGAGMDAVLDNDKDMKPFLFPNGDSLNAVRQVVDRYSTLNFRELPVSIPMPEWNQWLPIIHPDDAFDITDPAINSDQFGNDVGQPYYSELYDIATNNPTPGNIGRITIFIKRWLKKGLSCQTNGVGRGEPLRGLNGDVLSTVVIDLDTPDPTDVTEENCNERRDTPGMLIYEIAKRGLTAWSSVKLWEIAHGMELEEASQNMNNPVCSGGNCIDASEIRGWEIDGRNVFDRPPHFTGTAPGRRYFTQNQMLGILESNSWYHLNMVLNSGYRQSMPSHFAYTYSHVQLLQFESGVDQGFRYWATLIKQRQLQTNGNYGLENGLDLRTSEPYIYYGSARDTTNTDTHSNVGQPLWGRLATAFIEDLVGDASNATVSDWANASGNYSVQDRNSTNFSPCGNTCRFDIGPYQGRNTYRVIPKLRDIGVEESAINLLIDWAEDTWPNGPWDDVRE